MPDLHPPLVLGRDDRLLAPVSQEVKDELSDIPTSDRDVLDGRPDDVSIGNGDGVCHACHLRNALCPPESRRDSRVTPSPLSMTTPVNVRSATLLLDHEAARAKTAWTAMYL